MAGITCSNPPWTSTMVDQDVDPRSTSSPINPFQFQSIDPSFPCLWLTQITWQYSHPNVMFSNMAMKYLYTIVCCNSLEYIKFSSIGDKYS